MLQIGVLGPLTVERSGVPVSVPAGRARRLLGYLLIHSGSAHSIDMLTDLLWDGRPPKTAPTALHGFVSRLRKVFGSDVLRTTADGYRLAVGPEQIDSGRFAALVKRAPSVAGGEQRSSLLREALSLWRGAAYDSFRFEPFAQTEIAALEELRLCVVEEAIEADLSLGRHSISVLELRRLVQLHPLRERLWAQLMVALYRAESQAGALAVYRQAQAFMAEELGIDPGPRLRAVEQAILRQDPALMRELPDGTEVRLATKVDSVEPLFVARGRELRRLAERFGQMTETAQPAVLTLIGEAGVGKTRLAQEFAASVTAGALVLRGQCEADRASAWAPVRGMLSQIQGGHGDELRRVLVSDDPGAYRSVEVLAARMFSALARERPVLAVIDDIQWARASLLSFIAKVPTVAEGPVLFLCLARPEFQPTYRTECLTLGPIPRSGMESLVRSMAGQGTPSAVVTEIAAAASGNPLFATQLTAWAAGTPSAQPLPSALRALLASRIRGLAPGEGAVLYCAAIAGREFTVDALRALIPGAKRSYVEGHLRVLAARGLVNRASGSYAFQHPLIHEAAYAACDPRRRAPLHEAYAHWLAARGKSADEIVGYHFEQAHGNLLALHSRDAHTQKLGALAAVHLGEAGDRAFRHADMASAADLLTRAVKLLEPEHPQRLTLLLASARPLRTLGRMTEAVSALLEVIDRASLIGDVSSQWRARLELAYLRAVATPGDHLERDAFLVAEKAISVLEPLGDDEGLAVAWTMIAAAREPEGKLAEAVNAYQNAARHASRLPPGPYDAIVAWGLASALADGRTPVVEAIAECERLVGYRNHPQPGVRLELAILHAMGGDTVAAQRQLDEAEAEIHRRGVKRPLLFLAYHRARVALLAGDPADAERHARHGLALSVPIGGDESDGLNGMVLAQALSRQGRISEAEESASTYARLSSAQDIIRTAGWDIVRSEIRANRQAWADAIELAANAYALVQETDFVNVQADAALALTRAHHGAGNVTAAARQLEVARKLFASKGNAVKLTLTRTILAPEGR